MFGGHVADYMRALQDENEEKYKTHFSCYIKAGVAPDNVSCHVKLDHVISHVTQIEEMYRSAYAKIREDPTAKPKPKKEITPKRYRETLSLIMFVGIKGSYQGDNYKMVVVIQQIDYACY